MFFKYPWLLFLFLIYVPVIYFYLRKNKKGYPSIEVSTVSAFKGHAGGWKLWMMFVVKVLRLLAIGCLIVALARPQVFDSKNNTNIEGTDIVLALDVSGSMESSDIEPTRYDAAKKMAGKFIESREHDNMGLVAFAGESLTIMPLTIDRGMLLSALSNVRLGSLGDGTAIGDGLVSAINRVLGGTAVSKSVILLTDGTNNTGEIDPLVAAQIAKQKGVRVYTIGIGRNEVVPVSTMYGNIVTQVPVEIDEKSLAEIADMTGGKFFRATDAGSLNKVFSEIDRLEKSKIEVEHYSRADEDYMIWVGLALGLFVLELLLRYVLLRRIP